MDQQDARPITSYFLFLKNKKTFSEWTNKRDTHIAIIFLR